MNMKGLLMNVLAIIIWVVNIQNTPENTYMYWILLMHVIIAGILAHKIDKAINK